ncbi:MAG: TlpA disulfide reductase family protein [Psychroserpens sp.]|uniref:TlpA family protein disulfide reductase n=1 Tax=Psychroserpens sp. TaxID=2020870 RepID=UPI003003119C
MALPIISKYSESQIHKIDFSSLVLKKLNGETISLKKLSNSKKVVINFWATWCRPCRTEMPIMEQAYKSVKDDYVFVMINDENVETTQRYINENNYSFEFVQMNREAFIKNGIMERPTTLLLDSNFNIKEILIGEIPQKKGEEFVDFINGL